MLHAAMQDILHTASKYMWCTYFNPLSPASTIRGKKNMNILVDYSLLQVSRFRKASFLEKSFNLIMGRICRVLSHFEGGRFSRERDTDHHPFHRVSQSITAARSRMNILWHHVLILRAPCCLASSPPVCFVCEWGDGTGMGTHTHTQQQQRVIWCSWHFAASNLRVGVGRTHANTLVQGEFLSVNEGFFLFFFCNPVHLIKDTCELDSHYITPHSLLWLHGIYHEQPQFHVASANCCVTI